MKVKKTASIRMRMICLSVFVIVLFAATNQLVVKPQAQRTLTNMTKNYMRDMAASYGNRLTDSGNTGDAILQKQIQVGNALSDISINNYETTKVNIISKEGMVLYDTDAEKVGKDVASSELKDFLQSVNPNGDDQTGIIEYSEDGVERYAGYALCASQEYFIVISAELSEILQPIKALLIMLNITTLILLGLIASVSTLISRSITRPMDQMAVEIGKVSNLDMRQSETIHRLSNRKDEIGLVSKAILSMTQELHSIVGEIRNASLDINDNMGKLYDAAVDINGLSEDNSATSEELAASMEETSASTESIGTKVAYIDNDTKQIFEHAEKGKQLAEDIMVRAKALEEKGKNATQESVELYEKVKEHTQRAVEQAKAVEKINVMTETIKSIADQTSLLSLNASIEAARAGESGRGFSVVAEEIGHLAIESKETVVGISNVVKEIHETVSAMCDCLNGTVQFMEKRVLKDYETFVQVGENYNQDAKEFDYYMQSIHEKIDRLKVITEDINEAVEGINITIGEAASGVTDIAAKTSDVVGLTTKTHELVEENKTYTEGLDKIVSRFNL